MSNENPVLRQFNAYFNLHKPGWKYLTDAIHSKKLNEAQLKSAKGQARTQHDHEAVNLIDYLLSLKYDERVALQSELKKEN